MSAEHISKATFGLCTYLIKALHKRLPVAVRKCLYNHSYPSVLCVHYMEATVGSSIAVIKKAMEGSSSGGGFMAVLSRKKRRGGVLEDGIGIKKSSNKVQSGHSWGSKAGDTTESESVDMETECLVKETSIDYGERGLLAGGNSNQMPKSSRVKTKSALGKLLGKIYFSGSNDDNVFSGAVLELPPPLVKNPVNVLVRKSFTLDIGLDKIIGKTFQEKCVVVRKLFSGINGFGGVSTSSKFTGIIRATFTSELSLMKAIDKAANANILVNTNLKKSSGQSDQAVVIKKIPIRTLAETVHTALSKSVGGKTCIIDCHSVTYARTRCAVVCFDSVESLDAAVGTTPVLRNANLRWFHLISTKCTKCKKLGHMSLGCAVGGKFSSGSLLHRVFSDMDKSRLATIYAKCSAPIAHPVSFGGLSWVKVVRRSSSLLLSSQNVLVDNGSSSEMKPSLPVTMEVNNRFAALKRSLASLAEQVGKLAKRLDALGSTVPQSSPECQPLVTPSSQDQGTDVVMSEGLGASTSGGNIVEAVSFDMFSVSKLEDSMKCLMEMVLGLSAKVDSIGAHLASLPLTQ
ncbi:hypothetical protein G9A89_001467 [Geosiphon pyriformis]|nr:hypothetical protein G9A89_001467 [Geosiphon pyriformis]